MNYSDFVHSRSRGLIEVTLRAASAKGVTSHATLTSIANASFPFDSRDLRARTIWLDELYRQTAAYHERCGT